MSKAFIEKTIPTAIEVLDRRFPEGEIPSAYNGYIAAFGASVLQSGLKATLALYENKEAKTKADKSCLTRIILEILDPHAPHEESEGETCPGGSLLRYVLARPDEEDRLKERILDIATTLKLAIRTYKLIDNHPKEKSHER